MFRGLKNDLAEILLNYQNYQTLDMFKNVKTFSLKIDDSRNLQMFGREWVRCQRVLPSLGRGTWKDTSDGGGEERLEGSG